MLRLRRSTLRSACCTRHDVVKQVECLGGGLQQRDDRRVLTQTGGGFEAAKGRGRGRGQGGLRAAAAPTLRRAAPGRAAVRPGQRPAARLPRPALRRRLAPRPCLDTMLWVVAESRPVEISSANSTRLAPTSISPAVTRFFCLHGPEDACWTVRQPRRCACTRCAAHARRASMQAPAAACSTSTSACFGACKQAAARPHPPEIPRSMALPTCGG